jgi:hypothetical protein
VFFPGLLMLKSIVLAMGIWAALGVATAGAQDLKIEAGPTMRQPRPPELLHGTRSSDQNYYPSLGPSVPYDPAFIPPFTIEVETPDSTGRMGLSGWTAPNTSVGVVGTGIREINGWFSFGFTWTWGGPPPLSRPRAAADQPPAVTR